MYIDPGSTTPVLQLLLTGFTGLVWLLRKKIKEGFLRLREKK